MKKSLVLFCAVMVSGQTMSAGHVDTTVQPPFVIVRRQLTPAEIDARNNEMKERVDRRLEAQRERLNSIAREAYRYRQPNSIGENKGV